jgi:hypothetical protein
MLFRRECHEAQMSSCSMYVLLGALQTPCCTNHAMCHVQQCCSVSWLGHAQQLDHGLVSHPCMNANQANLFVLQL